MPTEEMTREYREVLQSVYITKTETLELPHVKLSHLPYHRIERLLQLSVISGSKLDKQLLKQLIRQKCDVCIRAKATDSKHTGKLRVPDNTWERFSMNLSTKFKKISIHDNYYQMEIINVKSKYVWDFYLETKDQVYPELKEWLATEIAAHRGRDTYGFEIVLFCDKGKALSIEV
jgi:hypothetical protein